MAADSHTSCTLTFIGTATVLLRFGPITVLTDPNFLHRGQRAYLGYGLSSRRRTDPAMSTAQLPELDAILLSHMHGDHWDRVAKRELDHALPVLTTPKAARALKRQGFGAADGLATWDSRVLQRDGCELRIVAAPGRHAVGLARRLLPPVMGTVLTYTAPDSEPLIVYITGDTLFVDDLRAIPERHPNIDTAVMHLGGTTLPGGLLVTMDAVQGADLLELVGPGRTVPIHNDDYGVFKSPLSAFLDETDRRGLRDIVRPVRPGETLVLRS